MNSLARPPLTSHAKVHDVDLCVRWAAALSSFMWVVDRPQTGVLVQYLCRVYLGGLDSSQIEQMCWSPESGSEWRIRRLVF